MKTRKILRNLFAALTVLLSCWMCAAVAYNYCALQWGGQYAGYSAPPSVAFFLAVPFGVGIGASGGLAVFFHRRVKKLSFRLSK